MPKCFLKVVSDLTLPARITLTDKSNRKWQVILEEVSCHLGKKVCLTEGWSKFAKETGLGDEDMVTFKRGEAYEFTVTMYDSNYIERELVRSTKGQTDNPRLPGSFAGVFLGRFPGASVRGSQSSYQRQSRLRLQTTATERLWHVSIRVGRSGLEMRRGWAFFAFEHRIEPNDVLVFTPTSHGLCFKVNIFATSGLERRFKPRLISTLRNRNMKFWKCIKKHTRYTLDIPVDWITATDLKPPEMVVLQNSEGREWEVGVERRRNNYGYRYKFESQGWRVFYDANRLRIGDVVEFEYTQIIENIIVVTPTDDRTTFMVTVFTEQGMECRVTLGPLALQARRLNFQKHMKKHMTYSLDIPVEWIRATGLQPPLSVVLQNTQGRQWQVGVERRRNNYGFRYKFESAAWHAFYVANGLRDGDLVEFQYLSAFGNHWLNMTTDVHLLFCLGSDSARIYGFAAKDVIVKPTDALVSQQLRPGFGPANLSKTLPSINTSSRHIEFAENPKVDKDITTTLFKTMSYRERLPIEEEYNWIQGTRDEIRLLRLVRDEAIDGAMEDTVTAAMATMRIVKIMTNILRSLIRPVDVACKIEEIRRRLEDFIWFISFPKIHFDSQTNTVYVSPTYWNRYEALHMEPHCYIGYRLVGEPNYTLLREVFMEGRVGTLDMQWIISTLDGLGDPEWMRMPLEHWWWE
ncbi:hypothetical protein C2S52_008513 [Perilla frutescens var. hirtella]|nr:hypothetical protein C2S52_008513 [Perilla frutescens var. hirtella]